ncbi:MAG: NIPSNAP family protein [Burkholderiales bacterium]|nr:NIPSNAP family protein [Burkholderiales bacterium]
MIYQHRLVIARGGRLVKRHAAFQREALGALEEHGSVLIGAWEVWIGAEAGCGVYQIRQFESLAAWEQHRERVHQDASLNERYRSNLSPHNDFVETAIVKCADGAPPLAQAWAPVDAVRGTPRGFFEQRILYFRPGTAAAHHRFYFEHLVPVLERDGATLKAFFDTVIGPGTTNTGSHRSIELRRFSDMASWQRWRLAQESDEDLAKLVKESWLGKVERVESVLLYPLDYSRMR